MSYHRLTPEEVKDVIDGMGRPREVTVEGDDTVSIRAGKIPLCDFCSTDANPAIVYQTTGDSYMATVDGYEHWSDDRWGACDPCAALIAADDHKGLADRSMAMFDAMLRGIGRDPNRVPYDVRYAHIKQAHDAFWGTKKP